jgi:hypothetical protein
LSTRAGQGGLRRESVVWKSALTTLTSFPHAPGKVFVEVGVVTEIFVVIHLDQFSTRAVIAGLTPSLFL